jgi:Asp-tRNA(Asn)/Glu-tRNA(Gln) amidotransferase A subunit family amidase
MSKVDHYKGTIVKIPDLVGKSFTESIDWLLANGHEIEDFELEDEYMSDPNVVVVNGEFYFITRTELDDDDDILYAKSIPGGYEFDVKYYNGGVSFDEALEDAVIAATNREMSE